MKEKKGRTIGATLEEWRLAADLSLIDLLPCVSDPSAKIASDSKLKTVGKIPSYFNPKGEVVGIGNWTKYRTNLVKYTRWSKNPNYSICLQTRKYKAIDVDVDDPIKAKAIIDYLNEKFSKYGIKLKWRTRSNSGKALALVRLPEGMVVPKQVIECDGGKIEFLSDGQQCLIAGVHSSGVSYEWLDGFPTPDDVPLVEDFDGFWRDLAINAGGVTKLKEYRERVYGSVNGQLPAEFLDRIGALSVQGGKVFFPCPWKENHSMDSGESQTVYFASGTDGLQGAFYCSHAGCADRKNEEFMTTLGVANIVRAARSEIIGNEFDTVNNGDIDNDAFQDLLASLKRRKDGKLENTIGNLVKVISAKEKIKFDTSSNSTMVFDKGNWRGLKDEDYRRILHDTEGWNFVKVPLSELRTAVLRVGDLNTFDLVHEKIAELPKWDGVSRIERFFIDIFGAQDTTYAREAGKYFWTALAGRSLEPGIKVDMVVVLVGKQGDNKNKVIDLIPLDSGRLAQVTLKAKDSDRIREIRNATLVEIPELDSGCDTMDVKNFITRRVDRLTKKYEEHETIYPRRCVFIGTTNEEEFLTDTTGHRRWLPIRCTNANDSVFEEYRLQYWAEAVMLYELSGVMYKQAEELAKEIHEGHEVKDILFEFVKDYVSSAPEKFYNGQPYVTSRDILTAFMLTYPRVNCTLHKIGRILRKQKFHGVQAKINGTPTQVWFYPNL